MKNKGREEKRKDVQMLYTYFVYVTTSPGGHLDLYADLLLTKRRLVLQYHWPGSLVKATKTLKREKKKIIIIKIWEASCTYTRTYTHTHTLQRVYVERSTIARFKANLSQFR
jgi:hypothetical protein